MHSYKIKTSLIVEGYSPRQNYKGKEELKRSIQKEGLLEPLLVYKGQKVYVIIDGNMRFRAVVELGFEEVDCIITDADEEKSYRLSYIKNIQRENFNPIEESLHLQTVMDKFKYNVEDLVRLGYRTHRSSLDNKLSLLSLPEDIQEKITDGTIKPTVGYLIAQKLDNERDQRKFAQDIINNGGMSPEKVKNKIKSLIDSRKNQGEKTQVEIPQGDIPGVLFKDSSDMSELRDASVGLIVTSPPYGVDMEYEKGMTIDDHIKNLERVLSECARVLCDGGKICINFADIHTYGSRFVGKPETKLMGHEFQRMLRKHGIRLIDEIIWEKPQNWKNNPQCGHSEQSRHSEWRILRNTEKIYIFQKDGKRSVAFHIDFESKISKDEWKEWVNAVWKIRPVLKQEGHPAQFPDELPRRLIKMFSFKGDIVLDCFGGTMTTVKVANELGRIGIGYEKDEKYKPTIMEKLGLTEDDLEKPEPALQGKEHSGDCVDQFQDAVGEILSFGGRSADQIMSVHVPVKDQISKDDITIEWNDEGNNPDPSTSPSPLQICKPDDYDADQVGNHPIALLPERCSDVTPHLNKIILGDSLDKLKDIPDNSVDLVATDPPYGMKFMGKDWDKAVPSIDIWKQCLRVLKPGAFAFVMSIPRQDCQSRMIKNLGEAGFKVDFTPIYWAYAQGFPKAQDVSKAIDKKLGAERIKIARNPNSRENCGKDNTIYRGGTVGKTCHVTIPATSEAQTMEGAYKGFQPKPAVEVIVVAMKPMDEKTYVGQALKNGKGITWMDDCRIPYTDCGDKDHVQRCFGGNGKNKTGLTWGGKRLLKNNFRDDGRFPANLLISDDVLNDGKIHTGGSFPGRRGETAHFGLNEKESNRVGPIGDAGGFSRYFSLDAWAEKNFPFLIVPKPSKKEKNAGCEDIEPKSIDRTKLAMKCKKCGKYPVSSDQNNRCECANPEWEKTKQHNFHPTVKPIKLMYYLITMGSREGDLILDPFTGSGSTCVAAKELNRKFIGIELIEDYQEIATKRVENAVMKMAA